jgi:hypothetical protein
MDAAGGWVSTPGGWALDFDGVNDYVVLDSQSNFMSDPLTLSGWLFTTTTNNRQGVVGSVSANGFRAHWFVTVNLYGNGKLNFWQRADGPFLNSATAVNTGEWIHWAVTRDPDGLTSRIWINGRLDASGTSVYLPQIDDQGPQITAIGRAGGFSGYYMTQQFADFGVWHRTLTAPEVGALYRAGQGGLGRLLTQRRRRVYSTTGPAFKAAWATRATTIAGVLR